MLVKWLYKTWYILGRLHCIFQHIFWHLFMFISCCHLWKTSDVIGPDHWLFFKQWADTDHWLIHRYIPNFVHSLTCWSCSKVWHMVVLKLSCFWRCVICSCQCAGAAPSERDRSAAHRRFSCRLALLELPLSVWGCWRGRPLGPLPLISLWTFRLH